MTCHVALRHFSLSPCDLCILIPFNRYIFWVQIVNKYSRYAAYNITIKTCLSAELRNVCPSCFHTSSDLNRYGLTKNHWTPDFSFHFGVISMKASECCEVRRRGGESGRTKGSGGAEVVIRQPAWDGKQTKEEGIRLIVYLSPLHSVWARLEIATNEIRIWFACTDSHFQWKLCSTKIKRHLCLWLGLSRGGKLHIMAMEPLIYIPVCLGQTLSLSLVRCRSLNPECHCSKSGGHGSSGQELFTGQQLGPTQG